MEWWNGLLEWNAGMECWNELGQDVCACMYRIAGNVRGIKFSRMIHLKQNENSQLSTKILIKNSSAKCIQTAKSSDYTIIR